MLERRIAVGGSAEVFLARPKLGIQPAARLVVKKLLRAARESGDFDALEREAELHRAVVHKNVVTVFGAGMVGDEPYLAMEYVEGVDLYRLLRRADADARKFPAALAAFIARRVASALAAGRIDGRSPSPFTTAASIIMSLRRCSVMSAGNIARTCGAISNRRP